ncbi:MFS transporter [Roseibium sp. RKSG952]|uniref:MFS transporter n=1 Tax=Roseibium sp. RKSG952 TaxID=2529384 RepID=UPI0012BC660D|nr:MFS transporter [Roseibium sp. RKSG952]MTH95571.1 MFS transporter [Roseibium sp. RKSG952]
MESLGKSALAAAVKRTAFVTADLPGRLRRTGGRLSGFAPGRKPGPAPVPGRTRQVLLVCAMGALSGIVLMDETLLGIALPVLRDGLGLSHLASHWVVNAYFLSLTCFAAIGGKCIDVSGARRVLIVSAAGFAVASLLAGLSGNGPLLTGMTALEGLFAAFLFPLSQAGSYVAFPVEQRGLAIGIYAAISTGFLALGPVAGGLILHFLSWHWIFWINIPVVFVSGALALVLWDSPQGAGRLRSIDWRGAGLMLAGLTGLVFALMEGAELGWGNLAVAAMALAGGAGLFLFWRYERKQARPLVDFGLFGNSAFTSAVLVYFMGQYAVVVMSVFFPAYLQGELGFRAVAAGLAMIAAVLPYPFASIPIGRLADRIGSRVVVIAGALLASLSMTGIGVLLSFHSYAATVPLLVIWGIAMACLIGPSRRAATQAASHSDQGQLSGTTVTLRLLGATAGMAVSSALRSNHFGYSAVFIVTGLLLAGAFLLALWKVRDVHGMLDADGTRSRNLRPDVGGSHWLVAASRVDVARDRDRAG